MNLIHHLHYFAIRYGKSILSVTWDLIAVAIAIGIGWALVPWVAPLVGRLWPVLIS